MAKASKFKGGKFLNVEAVEAMTESERTGKIDHISVEGVGGREKLVAYIGDLDLGLPLNTENIDYLIEAFGTDETDDWRGRKVELFVDETVRFQGRKVGGVRLRAIK